MGAGMSDGDKADQVSQRIATPLSFHNCPTRRRAIPYPNSRDVTYRPWSLTPSVVARSDYAGNMGSEGYWAGSSPSSYSAGDDLSEQEWIDKYQGGNTYDGVTYRRSQVVAAMIRDGLSNTYMVGEKYLRPEDYTTGGIGNDDQNLYIGHDQDILVGTWRTPAQDRPGWSTSLRFGSAHTGGFNVTLCDASVRTISYSIDPAVHRAMGARASGEVIDQSGF